MVSEGPSTESHESALAVADRNHYPVVAEKIVESSGLFGCRAKGACLDVALMESEASQLADKAPGFSWSQAESKILDLFWCETASGEVSTGRFSGGGLQISPEFICGSHQELDLSCFFLAVGGVQARRFKFRGFNAVFCGQVFKCFDKRHAFGLADEINDVAFGFASETVIAVGKNMETWSFFSVERTKPHVATRALLQRHEFTSEALK